MTQVPSLAQKISKIDEHSCIAKLNLRNNSLQISGWSWKGKVDAKIALNDIESIAAVPSRTGHNFFIVRKDASVLCLRMKKGSMSAAHIIKEYMGGVGSDPKLPNPAELRKAV